MSISITLDKDVSEPIGKQDYQDAVDLQNAVNIAAITRTFLEVLLRLQQELYCNTEPLRQHPIVRLFVYKLFSLCFPEPLDQYSADLIRDAYIAAYTMCGSKAGCMEVPEKLDRMLKDSKHV